MSVVSNIGSESPTNRYWNYIKDAPSNVKLKLISLLSESLTSVDKFKEKPMDTDLKKLALAKLCGSWKDEKSAEEIIAEIRENRTTRPPVEF